MSTTTTIRREAPFLEEFQRNLLQGAFDATKSPGTVTPREVAGLTALQTGAIGQTAAQMGIDPATGALTGQPAFGGAFDVGRGTMAMGIPALQMAQQQYDPTSGRTQQFMNQYQSDVTQEALRQMDEQAAKASAQLAGQAVKGGTFGGARYGVQQAELAKNLQDIKSRRIFEDLSRNFQQAQQQDIATSEAARNRNLQAANQFRTTGLSQAALGGQEFGLQQQGLGRLFDLGTAQQQQAQRVAEENFRRAEAMRTDPFSRLSYFSDILRGVPSQQTTIQQSPPTYTNPLMAGIGAGISAYNIMNPSAQVSSGMSAFTS